MVVEVLIVGVVFLSLCQNQKRRPTALIFALFTLGHDMLMSGLDGLAYYGSAALFDLCVITCLANIRQSSRLTVSLLKVSLVSIVLNFIVWLMWITYLPPLLYNLSYGVLYSYVIITLIKNEGVEHGDFKLGRWANCFRVYSYKSIFYSNKL